MKLRTFNLEERLERGMFKKPFREGRREHRGARSFSDFGDDRYVITDVVFENVFIHMRVDGEVDGFIWKEIGVDAINTCYCGVLAAEIDTSRRTSSVIWLIKFSELIEQLLP